MWIKKLQDVLKEKDIDLALIFSFDDKPNSNMVYFCNYFGVGVLAILKKKSVLIVPDMDYERALKTKLKVYRTDKKKKILETLVNLLKRNKIKKVGIEGPTEGKLVIDVYTTWCGPCKFVAPILHKLRDEGLIRLIQVDLDQNRPLGEMFGITAIPTLLFFKDGELLQNPIEVDGQVLVKRGIMVGAAGEPIMRQIIEKM